jgi:hypothetical protein
MALKYRLPMNPVFSGQPPPLLRKKDTSSYQLTRRTYQAPFPPLLVNDDVSLKDAKKKVCVKPENASDNGHAISCHHRLLTQLPENLI